ncbi:MAG: thioredoxin family protein [Flavobacterium sp.]|uniref:thioredoxin family protein n=1 Tax=unclassified Flavobacterium TaxID=196869 RepID=UPI000C1A2E35|nr:MULTISPECIES: thioredoxin family protein [unclassified Flavobacterium]MDP3680844.1 thioredoxin family protein [Flavobacterium sp.]PIF61583.1 thioredoxin-like protein [Flavobacterium sp. 11]WKL42689.1 thioredoxin family protein [Flavobacterium sp. ZE23DGlu08]
MKIPVAKALFNSHSYAEYRKLVSDLLLEGKSTGNEQSENLTHYSELNETRMNRLDKTMKITDENSLKLKSLKNEYIWLVISEGWCGDAAQLLPIINKMAIDSGKIELKIVLRDENEELMKLFLTNKKKSIPIVIVVEKATGSVLGKWGPRPIGATNLITDYKKEFGVIDETAKTNLQLWYLHDKGISTQNELVNLMLDLEQ